MRRTRTATAAAATLLLACAACSSADPTPSPGTSSPTPVAEPTGSTTEYESGPQSPIAYGLEVPKGATQLGPLVRFRSQRLIAAYQPELDAAEAQQEADVEKRREEAIADGETPPTPTPTPTDTPGPDTFRLIDDAPRPDVAVSVMRIDGSPTRVLQRVAGQVNAVLPDAQQLPTDDISEFCDTRDDRIASCAIRQTGTTADGRKIRITATIDPGNLRTRTGYLGSKGQPVMVLRADYLGDPRKGQDAKAQTVDVPSDVADGDTDTSGLVWPKMDTTAPAGSKVLDGWPVPEGGTVLLSGSRPRFAAIAADDVTVGDTMARDYATTVAKPSKDVLEDLNEITTTYVSKSSAGTATAVFVLAARGSFSMMFYQPR